MKQILRIATFNLFAVTFLCLNAFTQTAKISTDKADYAPGETVNISGSGFLAGETVILQVLHLDENGDNESSAAHQPFEVIADASGSIYSTWIVPADEDELGATLKLIADGKTSGLHAETTFTDAVSISGPTSACVGTSVTFTSSGAGLLPTYQWTKNGTNIPGATSASYTISSVTAADAAGYALKATPFLGSTSTSNTITLTINPSPTVPNAGPDQTICSTTATLAANTPSVGSGMWTLVSGSGTVTNPSSPTSEVTGLGTGANTFRWTTTLGSCSLSDNVIITRTTTPSTANAGSDQTICVTGNATLAANNPSVGTGAWSVVSGPNTNSTQFNNVANRTATFTPAGGAGIYILRWTISNTCGSSTSDVNITVNPTPTTANAGSAQSVCIANGNTSLAANAPTIGTGNWSVVSGPNTSLAQFSNTSDPGAIFTPAGGAGNYTLRWTITNAPCAASTNNVVITFTAQPTTSNAGPDQTICATGNASLAANAPSAGTGAWSVISGPSTSTAQFSSLTSRTATFTPAGGAGIYQLRWTISSGACTPSTDEVAITVNALPTASNAGPDQTLCISAGNTTLSANMPVIGTGAWSVTSGPSTSIAQFNNAGDPSAIFTPAGGAGVYNLRWTIANAPCAASVNDVIINMNDVPQTVSATPLASTICYGQSVSLSGSAVISAATTLLSDNFNGTSIFTASGSNSGGGTIFSQQSSGFLAGLTAINNNDGSKFMIADAASFLTATTNSTLTTSPVINTNGYSALSLTFRQTYQKGNEAGVSVQVSTDPGNTVWNNISTAGNVISTQTFTASQGASNNFIQTTINLTPFVNQSNLKFRFNFSSSVLLSTSWWAIDDVVLTGTPIPVYTWSANTATGINGLPVNATNPLASNNNISVQPTTTTSYTLTATNSATNCSANAAPIVVHVNKAPSFTKCPSDISVNNDAGACSAIVNYSAEAEGIPAPSLNYTFTGATTGTGVGTGSGSTFNVGVTTIVITASNSCAPNAVCSFKVTVTDNEAPVITAAANINVNNDAGQCGATVNITAATATDNCGVVATLMGVRSDGLGLQDAYPVGTTTITWNVADVHGNAAAPVTQTVTVKDNEVPVITAAANISVNNDAGQCGATVNITAATATDNCGVGMPTGVRSDALAITAPYPVGTTTITWNVTDGHGNAATPVAQTVTVTDNEAPVITAAANINVNNDGGQCGATVNITTATAMDNCSVGMPTGVRSDGLGLQDAYPLGTTTITWKVTDVHGNVAAPVTQTVTVTDKEAPVITAAANISVNNDAGQCGATVNITAATATDNCGVAGTPMGVRSDGLALNDPYPKGITTINWDVTDIHGNKANTVAQTVTVKDNELPSITCPSNIVLSACESIATWTVPDFSDNCPGAAISQTAGPASGATFANGTTTTISYTVTDASNNKVSCSFTVTRAPMLIASSSTTPILCNGDLSTITVTASGGVPPYTGTGTFPHAAGAYSYTIMDANGCTATATGTIAQPTLLAANGSNSNPQLYFGSIGDQTSTIKIAPSGGVAPYKISITMDRPLKCNYVTDAGDETWSSSGGTSANITCPANPGLATLNPVSTITGVNAGGSLSVKVGLMVNASFTATVTDANGCSQTYTTTVNGEDVRCFAGKSGIAKVAICHKTGSAKNPYTQICVDESAVQAHLDHGDVLGNCPTNSVQATEITKVNIADTTQSPKITVVAPDGNLPNLHLQVYPNPSASSFKLMIESSNKEQVEIRVLNMDGKIVYQNRGAVIDNYVFGNDFKTGMYIVQVIQGTQTQSIKIIKGE